MPTRRFLNSLLVSFLLGVTINAADFTEQYNNLSCAQKALNIMQANDISPISCVNGARCVNPNCRDIHDCTHKAKCYNCDCKLRHPAQRLKPCRDGVSCNKGKDCPFLHPSQRQREKKN
jgi:hypothetical protein